MWIPARPIVPRITFVLALFLTSAAAAQEFRATITGRVSDPNGLVVPGAIVTATNSESGELASATTTTEGVYTIPFLKPGLYTVAAELTGFRKVSQANVRLELGQTAAVNFQLQLGELSEQVSVIAESPILEAAKADRGLVIDNDRVNELPLNARNPCLSFRAVIRKLGPRLISLRIYGSMSGVNPFPEATSTLPSPICHSVYWWH